MYLHLGQDTVIRTGDIVGIFDLAKAEKKRQVVTVSYELPKSFILCKDKKRGKTAVYISQLSSATLLKRKNMQKDRAFIEKES